MRYEGEFENGRKHGQGTCYFFPENPETCTRFTCFAGFCHQLVRDEDEIADTPVSTISGQIKLLERIFRYDPTTTCVYRGEWKDDLFHGRGTYSCCDGRKYEGQYVRGKRQGYGTQSLVPKSQKGDPARLYCGGMSGLYRPYVYTGLWSRNAPCGHGKTQFAPTYQCVDGIHDEMLNVHGIAKVEWPKSGKTIRARYKRGWRLTWIRDDVDLNVDVDNFERNAIIWSRSILSQSGIRHRRRESIGERRRRSMMKKRREEKDDDGDGDDDNESVVVEIPHNDEEIELSLPPGFGDFGHEEEEDRLPPGMDLVSITEHKNDDWILSEPPVIESPQFPPSLFERPPGF